MSVRDLSSSAGSTAAPPDAEGSPPPRREALRPRWCARLAASVQGATCGVLLLALALLLGVAACARDEPQQAGRGSAAAVQDVALDALPSQARETLALIRKGGPFPYRKDGTTFFNRERLLPPRPRGYYTEYTVPTPGSRDRGARRIVAGKGATGDPATSGEYYYTDDHYRSFRRIRP